MDNRDGREKGGDSAGGWARNGKVFGSESGWRRVSLSPPPPPPHTHTHKEVSAEEPEEDFSPRPL